MIDNRVEEILLKWRSYAEIKDIIKKREARFKYLCELQELFLTYDLELIRDIVIGLCTQCHGAEYDYSKLVINKPIRFTEKIPVICNKHGIFVIQLFDHLLPSHGGRYPIWCHKCASELNNYRGTIRKRSNGTMFIVQSELIHGSKYDYRLIKYVAILTKILLICSTCQQLGVVSIKGMPPGVIYQTPHRNLEGRMCRTCTNRFVGERNSSDDDKIFRQIHDKHGDKYICLSVLPAVRPGAGRRIRYYCKACDAERIQKVNNILNNNGCKYCSIQSRILSFDEFVVKSREIHGDKYDYIDFGHNKYGERNIHYWCRNCNAIKVQRISAHLIGKGCKRCAERGPTLAHIKYPMYLYLIKLQIANAYDEIVDCAYKIGCTKNGVKVRFRNCIPKNVTYTTLYEVIFDPGKVAFSIEQDVITKFFKHTYTGRITLPSGNNELFEAEVGEDILQYIKELAATRTVKDLDN